MNNNYSGGEGNTTYEVTFEERQDYLYVYVQGPKDILDESIRVWKEIAQQCKRKGYKTVLIDEDLGTQLSVPDLYTFAAELPKIGFLGITIVLVDRRGDQLADNLFAETVGVNRGLIGKVFSNMAEAEEWLLPKK